jgi:DNA-binding NarL/FixJ family response regulator
MIADELGRRPSTIAEHRTEACKRLGVEARVELPEMFDHP